MTENPLLVFVSFYFNKAPVVTIAVILTLSTLATAVGFFFYIIYVRVKSDFYENRKKKNFDLWSVQLFQYLSEELPDAQFDMVVKNKDLEMFIEFLFYYLENIRGGDAKKIRNIFREQGLLDRELEQLRDSSDYFRRALAAYRLGQIRADEAKKDLAEALSDENDLVSYAASTALMKMGDSKSVGKILAILLAKENLSGEMFAEILLGYGKGVVAEISESLAIYNELPRSRTKILDFLGHYRRVEVAPFLTQLLETSNSDEERIHVIKALGNLVEIGSFPALVRCLKNHNPTIRSQAAKALGNFKDETAFEALAGLLGDQDWWCRFHAATAIFKTGRSGEDYLRKLFKETEDPFTRDVIRQLVNV
ncbi:MAG: HEAT repeat domain-containing protein [Candidatus Nitrohelix vancouverensis]|uniref:HEAT repeat domain-containing protein n=1 Tax=Candidatus Nitrohelix vancouverensis TaxID=2705534 RepID=A0A7T0C0N2_9BACT|nr:MAG: HEAT repeat domain-containing protein [Candidatus Nitrohelix vancouverensis]